MGVQHLLRIIKENAPDAIREMQLSELRGWVVGLDASISIYQWCAVGRSRNIRNADGKYINHIQGTLFRTATLLKNGIRVVYVFDGPPPAEKEHVLGPRRVARQNGAVKVPQEVFDEVAKLLSLMDVQVVFAPGEAEAQIASMHMDGIITEDIDSIVFGAKNMIKLGTKTATIINGAAVLAGLRITRAQLIDLSILLGCDYTRTLPGIGPKRALDMIRRYGSIEKILAGEKITEPEDFNFVAARRLFVRPTVRDVDMTDAVAMSDKKISSLREFLVTVHGLSPARIDKTLEALKSQ